MQHSISKAVLDACNTSKYLFLVKYQIVSGLKKLFLHFLGVFFPLFCQHINFYTVSTLKYVQYQVVVVHVLQEMEHVSLIFSILFVFHTVFGN